MKTTALIFLCLVQVACHRSRYPSGIVDIYESACRRTLRADRCQDADAIRRGEFLHPREGQDSLEALYYADRGCYLEEQKHKAERPGCSLAADLLMDLADFQDRQLYGNKYQLGMTHEELVDRARSYVARAEASGPDAGKDPPGPPLWQLLIYLKHLLS